MPASAHAKEQEMTRNCAVLSVLYALFIGASPSWGATVQKTNSEKIEGSIRGKVVLKVTTEKSVARCFAIVEGKDILSVDEDRIVIAKQEIKAIIISYKSMNETPSDEALLTFGGMLMAEKIDTGTNLMQIEGSRFDVDTKGAKVRGGGRPGQVRILGQWVLSKDGAKLDPQLVVQTERGAVKVPASEIVVSGKASALSLSTLLDPLDFRALRR
jgi:hypothetical protein